MSIRFRQAAAAAAACFALAVALPGSAHAAAGEFRYTYYDDANRTPGVLIDPDSRTCVTLPEVADPDTTEPAFAPENLTDSTATMFTGPDCDGDYYSSPAAGPATASSSAPSCSAEPPAPGRPHPPDAQPAGHTRAGRCPFAFVVAPWPGPELRGAEMGWSAQPAFVQIDLASPDCVRGWGLSRGRGNSWKACQPEVPAG